MEIHISDNPAKKLGETLTEEIIGHTGDTVCFLSGGSALEVVKYIPAPENECRTIFMMGDERWSREKDENNSLQLLSKYPDSPVAKNFIASVPEENESLRDFAVRIENQILNQIKNAQNLKIISLLGIGPDGHTAGIFPQPNQESFLELYPDDRTYVPVHIEGLKIDSRASLTPHFLLHTADKLFAYVTGENKTDILNSLLKTKKEVYERPAELIKQHQNAELFTDIDIIEA